MAESMAARFRCELRRLRRDSGLTQRALADRVRFSREMVAAVEAGRRYGSLELAVRCDEALGGNGLLTGLWPQVAQEQIAADGRRGPRSPQVSEIGAADQGTVEAAIDELRELLDRVHRVLGQR
jgi:transcriptional regulator with XRE-family HTH domain